MVREFANEADIVELFADRLADKVPGVTAETVLITTDQFPNRYPTGDLFLTVAEAGGQFNDALFAGGGHEQVSENISLVVSIFASSHLDRSDEARAALLAEDKGIIRNHKRDVLRALLVSWEPETGGNLQSRSMPAPSSSTPPQYIQPEDGGKVFIMVALTFAVVYDWNLGE